MSAVYRVENEQGHGPYRAQGRFDDWGSPVWTEEHKERVRRAMELNDGLPFPQLDIGDRPPFPGGVFGAPSLEKLKVWFPDVMQSPDRIAKGFHVVEYLAPSKRADGTWQVYFTPDGPKRVIA